MFKFSSLQSDSPAGKIYRWFRIVFLVSIALCAAYFVLTYRTWTLPPDCKGMAPNFAPGHLVVIHKRMRRAAQLQRGDIVLFGVVDPKSGAESRLISRVVGLEGETVEVVEGQVRINGQMIDDVWNTSNPIASLKDVNARPVTVEPRTVYVLNDDRLSTSPDTRTLGLIPEKAIAGKVFVNLSF